MNKVTVTQEHKNIIGKLALVLKGKEQVTDRAMIERVRVYFPEYRAMSDQDILENFDFNPQVLA